MKKFYLSLFAIISSAICIAQTSLINTGATWKYIDNGTDQGTTWTSVGFNDASWASGISQLGYGDGDEATVVSYGANSSAKYATTYFRNVVAITNSSQYVNYTLKVKRDDGIIVYVNGVEVFRDNMGTGAVPYNNYAASTCSDDGNTWLTANIASTAFVNGNNTIAAEIHQANGSSSDISFDLQLIGNTTSLPVGLKDIRWGSQSDPLNGLTVTWSNNGSGDSIQWGYTTNFEQGKYSGTRRNANATSNYFFKYVFTSAQANSTIYYKLYDSNVNAWSGQFTYNTAPPVNTGTFCFLAAGDSRSDMGTWAQIANLAHSKNADFTIYNGDIVSDGESNTDWDDWFSNGNQFIQNNLIYHSMGNHDAGTSNKYSNTFDLPVVSGSNLHYSFTYSNALFICLNSEDPSNTSQYNWLINTLIANQSATWKIVFFHKPFYTIGQHAGEMNSYLNTIWKAFDDYGVDLVCNGHDHMYERTKPINRNVSTTAPVSNYGSNPGQGRCQIVCGGAGAPLYTGTPTNLIQQYQSKYNFCKFCVNGGVLHGEVFDNTNAVIDTFSLIKPYNTTAIEEEGAPHFNPIEVYPNPSKNSFVLKAQSAQKGEGVVRIVDLNGAVVKQEKIKKMETNFEYEINNLTIAAGTYFVELIINQQKDVVLLMIK